MENTFLKIDNLNISFKVNDCIVNILNNVSFNIKKSSSTAIIGESGSGKSVFSKVICGILPTNLNKIDGTLIFDNKKIEIEKGIDRDKIGIVLQNPMTTFNPTLKIGKFMKDVFKANNIDDDKEDSKKIKIIKELGIANPKNILNKYPHELSGGMLQRLAIGIALVKKPEVLICDEPTSSLDVITQKRIIKLIKEEKERQKFTLIFITHDIGIIEGLCDEIIVMQKGNIIEKDKTSEVLKKTQKDYTKNLIKSSII